jgi:hypothetical protein
MSGNPWRLYRGPNMPAWMLAVIIAGLIVAQLIIANF